VVFELHIGLLLVTSVVDQIEMVVVSDMVDMADMVVD
jgi:hypothetical protein